LAGACQRSLSIDELFEQGEADLPEGRDGSPYLEDQLLSTFGKDLEGEVRARGDRDLDDLLKKCPSFSILGTLDIS